MLIMIEHSFQFWHSENKVTSQTVKLNNEQTEEKNKHIFRKRSGLESFHADEHFCVCAYGFFCFRIVCEHVCICGYEFISKNLIST